MAVTAMSTRSPVISLDFGISNSSIAVSTAEIATVLPNNRNKRYTPSLIAFSEGRILVGEEAMKPSVKVKNIINGMKRLIGFSTKEKFFEDYPFKIFENDGKLLIQIQGKRLTVKEIIAMYFLHLKEHVESEKVLIGAVLTIPSSFGTTQCRALQDAAYIAGIQVMEFITETTAAAINFALENKMKESKLILTFQMGGGLVDVAVFDIAGTSVELLASVATDRFGGEDFDRNLLKYALEHINIEENADTLGSLLKACEKAKTDLGLSNNAKISMEYPKVNVALTKQKFESINGTYLHMIRAMINAAIHGANKLACQINHYFLIGRSTRMPSVIDILENILGRDKRRQIVEADKAAVKGAAQFAEHISGKMATCLQLSCKDVGMKYKVNSNQGKVTVTCVREAHEDGSLVTPKRTWHKSLDVMLTNLKSVSLKLNTEIVIVTNTKRGLSMAEVHESIRKIERYRKKDKDTLRLEEDIGDFNKEIAEVKHRISLLIPEFADQRVKAQLWRLFTDCENIESWIESKKPTGGALEEKRRLFQDIKNETARREKNLRQMQKNPGTIGGGEGFRTTSYISAFLANAKTYFPTEMVKNEPVLENEIERLKEEISNLRRRIRRLKCEAENKHFMLQSFFKFQEEVEEIDSLIDIQPHTFAELETQEKRLNTVKRNLDKLEDDFREIVAQPVLSSSTLDIKTDQLKQRATQIKDRATRLQSLTTKKKDKLAQHIHECNNIIESQAINLKECKKKLDIADKYLRDLESKLNKQKDNSKIV